MASGCIPYAGSRNAGGYGVLPAPIYGSRLAHRAALAEALGRPVRGNALHSCDNPPCINPEHLREGTQADNVADMIERGRESHALKARCIRGHELSEENTKPYRTKSGYIHRRCIPCRIEDNQNTAARRKARRHERMEARHGG